MHLKKIGSIFPRNEEIRAQIYTENKSKKKTKLTKFAQGIAKGEGNETIANAQISGKKFTQQEWKKRESAYIGEGGRGNAWVGSWNTIRVRTPRMRRLLWKFACGNNVWKPPDLQHIRKEPSQFYFLFRFWFELPFNLLESNEFLSNLIILITTSNILNLNKRNLKFYRVYK